MARLILDTGVLIEAERNGGGLASVLADDDDAVIAALTLAELQVGVEVADDTRRESRQEFVDGVRALLPVENYDADVAAVHARLLAHVRLSGRPRGAHDLIIAATAVATARELVTSDGKAAFGDLPGVHVIRATR